MIRIFLLRVTALAALAGPTAAAAQAPAAAATGSVCKDGTTDAASGRGACSHHGGVDRKATQAAHKAATATPAAPAASPAAVTCADGTTSKRRGRGACSRHGGIAGSPAATAAAPATAAASPAGPRVAAPAGRGGERGEDNDAAGAIAKCKDGLYSHAAHRRGACSRHGGVAQWLGGR